MAYDQLSPIGPERADWRAALVASTTANMFRGKGQKAYQPADFMPKFAGSEQRRTPEQIEAMMMQWARQHNRAEERKRERGNNRKNHG